jgi:uracil-DNA glycosylase family 4
VPSFVLARDLEVGSFTLDVAYGGAFYACVDAPAHGLAVDRGRLPELIALQRELRPALEAELDVVQPRVLVCLGATAAQALLGRDFRVSRMRGEPVESNLAEHVLATVHPSAILRADEREIEFRAFVKDLEKVATLIRG